MMDKKIEPYPNVAYTDLDDEGVLLNLETRDYYTLNKPGMYVWKLIENGLAPNEVVRRVQEEFSVDEEIAIKNVCDLIHELVREKLIQVMDE